MRPELKQPAVANPKPVIALTMGDPAGIGPELCLAMLRDRTVLKACVPVLFGDARLLARVAGKLGLPFDYPVAPVRNWSVPARCSRLVVDMDCLHGKAIRPGHPSAATGSAACQCVVAATQAAMARRVDAIVTAPLSKEALHLAGIPHPGHTELLAELTGTGRYCMMLASERITTSLVTTHTALRNVPDMIRAARVLEVIRLTHAAMRSKGRRRPRLIACGLNPHGGENGLLGREEHGRIAPAVAKARGEGIRIEGPVPPDTAFLPERLAQTDAYVCMYHDQGLIPFKMLAFETGVNVTLGLPVIRTSPDHGTAFDLAWKGRANPSSMRSAVLYAARLAVR